MAALLEPACCTVSKLVCHALWISRALLHGTLVFAHVVLTNTLGVRRYQEIQDKITRRMDLWEIGLHAGLVGDAEAEGAVKEGRAASVKEEEDEAVTRSYHDTVLSGKLCQAICR